MLVYRMKETNKTRQIVRGALFLTLAGLISKVLSALYRIPLQNLTGDFGFYIYQQVYPLIGIAMMLALYGFPVAVSKLVAERKEKRLTVDYRHVYLPLFVIMFTFTGILTLILFIFSKPLAVFVEDLNLAGTYKLAAVMFLPVPLLSLLRGASQGRDYMQPTAYSQITEQLVRVSIIIMGAYFVYLGKWNPYQIGDIGILALLIGMAAAVICLLLLARHRSTLTSPAYKEKEKIPWNYYIKTIFNLGIIAALSHMVLLFMQLADVFTIVPALVDDGLTQLEAKEMKGVFDRGQTLIQFGVVFGSSFALALVPAVARKSAAYNHAVRNAMLISFYLASAGSIGLMILMPEVNELLFLNTEGTLALRILMLAVVLSAMIITACSILQNLGYVNRVALFIVGAFLIKWGLNRLLVPNFQIVGSAAATVISLGVLLLAVVILLH